MGVVLFVTPYFYKNVAPPVKKAVPVPPPPSRRRPARMPPAAPPTPAETVATAPPSESGSAPPVAAQKEEQLYTIDTDVFRISFSNRGGVVKSWLLKKYKAHSGEPLELVNTAAKVEPPFALYFPGPKPSADLNQALYEAKPDPDGLGISFDFSDGSTTAHKPSASRSPATCSNVSTEVTAAGKPLPHLIEWRGGFGDLAVANPSGAGQTLRFDVTDGKLVKSAAKAAKNGPVTATGNYSFAGIEDAYFVAAFLPERAAAVEIATFSDNAPTVLDQKETAFAGTAVGAAAGAAASDGVNRFELYVGPKDIDILRAVNPKLEQVVDFGWLSILAKPLFLIVNWVGGPRRS